MFVVAVSVSCAVLYPISGLESVYLGKDAVVQWFAVTFHLGFRPIAIDLRTRS